MAIAVDCLGCLRGEHDKHEAKHGIMPDLIGGEYCDCKGDCPERSAAAFAKFKEGGLFLIPVKKELNVETEADEEYVAIIRGAESRRFGLCERVAKRSGDYTFEGEIVGIFRKKGGAIRVVVEDDRGLLFIFNQNQLEVVK